jgi:hypothetical protein
MPLLAALALQTTNPIRLLAPVQLREEADLIRVAVETLNPGATRFLSAKALAARGRELEREAGYAGDTATWYRAVSRYLAGLRSEATVAEWPDRVRTWRQQNPSHLPFRVSLVDGKAIVTQATEDSGVTVGDELLEIEGRRVGDIRKGLAPWTSVEGRTDYAKDAMFGEGLDNYGPILWGLRSSWNVRFRQGGVRSVKGIPFEPWQKLRSQVEFAEGVSFERLPGRVAVLRVASFANDRNRADPVAAFRPHLEALRREPGIRLILDLRGCGGDSTDVPIALLRYLAPEPPAWASEVWLRTTAVAERLRPYLATDDARLRKLDEKQLERRPDQSLRFLPQAAPEWLTPTPALPKRFDGPVDVLVDSGTTSAATTFVARLRSARPVRVVGEPTGGSVEGMNVGASWRLRLPHSGLIVHVPAFRMETGAKPASGRGVTPDVIRRRTVDDALGKTDSVREWVVANPPEPKKAGKALPTG